MAEKMENNRQTTEVIRRALELARLHRHQFVTPEHLLLALTEVPEMRNTLTLFAVQPHTLPDALEAYFSSLETLPEGSESEPGMSEQSTQILHMAFMEAYNSGKDKTAVPHYVYALLQLEESWASYLLRKAISDDTAGFMACLIDEYRSKAGAASLDEDDLWDDDEEEPFDDGSLWKRHVSCLNDMTDSHNPLIGRDAELERTIQVLCRKDKNNPLHVGEPGVGKTALVYGLAERINQGNVPERLRDCHIYAMEMGSMIAGTQYRGDFEKRIKEVMEGARREGHAIIYIDEIHNMVGAGSTADGSLDASNMLKPYLESGDIRFIGSTTYDEYKRHFATSKGIVRRFQQIDIQEPSVPTAIEIIKGLQPKYEAFHHVTYTDGAVEYAVEASARYVADRFLPDKAIDLIDEAGAYRELHPVEGDGSQTVDRQLIGQILAATCKIDAAALRDEGQETLRTLHGRVGARIFGQDEAVRQAVEAVEMAKAGLQDEGKPLASLLFVGPTGVGKTEVARVLAQELGISLVRFDMSEYAEKHAVAKLIGSPAGYVGYEDGGQLTDAIRKSPNCVLLLDEIEKAHPDIYNILLQVMDYAVLTDNRGQKADFRNVVLIMTSNAGAQFASQANVGFTGSVSRGSAMMAQVRRTFKPEFLNRLSATVVFHDMDRDMARRILGKKLGELQQRLSRKSVTLSLSDDAVEWLLQKGFTPEYGAREIDRVITRELKPLLMREILFGSLTGGGNVNINVSDDCLAIG